MMEESNEFLIQRLSEELAVVQVNAGVGWGRRKRSVLRHALENMQLLKVQLELPAKAFYTFRESAF